MRNYFQKKYIIGFIVASVLVHSFNTMIEMNTFNKLNSGPDVTFLEALVNDLRIDTE